jgi:diguanylate cyclase (GGDEF)-like protein
VADRGSVARLPHVAFACLFAGLALFAVTGSLLVRDVVQLVAVALLATAAVRRPDARLAWGLLAVANAAWAVGDLDPARLNALFLVSFAFAQLGLVTLAATQLRSRWLAFDGIIVGLTAAAILTAYVSDSLVGLGLRVPATALAGDAMLVTTIVLAFAVNGWRPARAWWVIAFGEAFLVVNDLTLTNPLAPPRSALVAWAAALLLTSYAAFHPSAPRERRVGGAIAAGVPITAGTVCVGLLIHAALTHGHPVTVWLAGSALLVGLVRCAFLLRENQRLVRSARAEAVTDKLTGLPNRRALIDDLDRVVAARTTHTLAFFDLDGFKEYNDAFGHAAGDALLQRLALRLAAVGRAYRLGGDEFCLLADAALEVAPAVAALSEGEVTASHGLVSIPAEARTAADALRLADERMYARKRGRRAGRADVLLRMLAEHGLDEDRAAAFASAFSAASSAASAPAPVACGPAGSGRTSAPAA